MVRIRLRRQGAKGQPTYRVVVTEKRTPRDGRFIERIGHYNPRTEPMEFHIDEDRARYWLGVGAQPTDAVKRLMVRANILSQDEKPYAEAAVAAPAEADTAEAAVATPMDEAEEEDTAETEADSDESDE